MMERLAEIGLDVDDLGVRTSTGRLLELLHWAADSGAWIVEAHFNDEIVYDRELPASLWSTDESDRRAQWLEAFNTAAGKLRPHLADGASEYLGTVGAIE